MQESPLSFEENLVSMFSDHITSYEKSQELYSALCNNTWIRGNEEFSCSWRAAGEMVAGIRNSLDLPRTDPNQCRYCLKDRRDHIEDSQEIKLLLTKEVRPVRVTDYFCSEEKLQRFVPGYSGQEDYLDFYCSGNEGQIADWIKEEALRAGYKIAPISAS